MKIKNLKKSCRNNIAISLTAGTIGSIASALTDRFANKVSFNISKTIVVGTNSAFSAYILKNYVKKCNNNDILINVKDGVIIGGLCGSIINQIITNTNANTANSKGQSLNDFYN